MNHLPEHDDPFHLAARVALAPVLEALGVVGVSTTAGTRTWTFEDDVAVPIHERRHQHEPLGPVQALARALGIAIRDVDALDDDHARLVRLALAEVLDAARERVVDEWEVVVLREFGKLLVDANIRKAEVTVGDDGGVRLGFGFGDPHPGMRELEQAWGEVLNAR